MFSSVVAPIRYAIVVRMALVCLCCMLGCVACGTANWRAPLESSSRETPSTTVGKASFDAARKTYRVQAGDTLYGIAWRSQQTLQQLARLNNLSPPYLIRVGQVVRLHPAQPATQQQVSSSPARAPTKPRPKPSIRSSLDWAWPVTGKLLSTFKAGDAVRKGVKIAAKLGTPVRATEAGRVVYSGSGLIGYGRLIIIKHNADFLSAYGHNRTLLVKTGQTIKKGQKIAELGTTNAGKSLLHFEIRHKGKPIDPLRLLPSR